MKLPSKKGEDVVVWHHEEDGCESVRIIMVGHGQNRWSMRTQTEAGEGEWCDGGSFKLGLSVDWGEGLTSLILRVARAEVAMGPTLADVARFCLTGEQQIKDPMFDMQATGRQVLSQTKGKKQFWVEVVGSNYDGSLAVEVGTNKPLHPGEWMLAMKALAGALTRFRESIEEG